MARDSYSTAGKKRLLDFLIENKDRQMTLEQIADGLPDIGRSSVYRMVKTMHGEGTLKRFECDTCSSFVYQYMEQGPDCSSHFHLKCTECGKIIHMRCEALSAVSAHIASEHDFYIGSACSFIYGLCGDCARKLAENSNIKGFSGENTL